MAAEYIYDLATGVPILGKPKPATDTALLTQASVLNDAGTYPGDTARVAFNNLAAAPGAGSVVNLRTPGTDLGINPLLNATATGPLVIQAGVHGVYFERVAPTGTWTAAPGVAVPSTQIQVGGINMMPGDASSAAAPAESLAALPALGIVGVRGDLATPTYLTGYSGPLHNGFPVLTPPAIRGWGIKEADPANFTRGPALAVKAADGSWLAIYFRTPVNTPGTSPEFIAFTAYFKGGEVTIWADCNVNHQVMYYADPMDETWYDYTLPGSTTQTISPKALQLVGIDQTGTQGTYSNPHNVVGGMSAQLNAFGGPPPYSTAFASNLLVLKGNHTYPAGVATPSYSGGAVNQFGLGLPTTVYARGADYYTDLSHFKTTGHPPADLPTGMTLGQTNSVLTLYQSLPSAIVWHDAIAWNLTSGGVLATNLATTQAQLDASLVVDHPPRGDGANLPGGGVDGRWLNYEPQHGSAFWELAQQLMKEQPGEIWYRAGMSNGPTAFGIASAVFHAVAQVSGSAPSTTFGAPTVRGWSSTHQATGFSGTAFGHPTPPTYYPSGWITSHLGIPSIPLTQRGSANFGARFGFPRLVNLGAETGWRTTKFGPAITSGNHTLQAKGWQALRIPALVMSARGNGGVAHMYAGMFGASSTTFGTPAGYGTAREPATGWQVIRLGQVKARVTVHPTGIPGAVLGTPYFSGAVRPVGFSTTQFGAPKTTYTVHTVGAQRTHLGTPSSSRSHTYLARGFKPIRLGHPKGSTRTAAHPAVGWSTGAVGTPTAHAVLHTRAASPSTQFGTPLLSRGILC